MPTQRTDRRIERTRQTLRQALLDLIVERGYDALTVQDVLDRANVGRSTFYAHFRDMDDLLLSGFDQLQRQFAEHLGEQEANAEGPWTVTLLLFRHAHDQHALYKALAAGPSGQIFVAQVHKLLAAQMRVHLKAAARRHKLSVPYDVVAQYTVSSLVAMLTWWLDQDRPYSPERMSAMYRQLVEPGVMRALGVA